MKLSPVVLMLSLIFLLNGCGRNPQKPIEGTIGSIPEKNIEIEIETPIRSDLDLAITSYRELLKSPMDSKLNRAASRRLADLEMEFTEEKFNSAVDDENQSAPKDNTTPTLDYENAIAIYKKILKDNPNAADNDQILYQLARAYDQSGKSELALATLDQLVQKYPSSEHFNEAQFRRGEMLFNDKQYVKAEQAYGTIISKGVDTRFYENSLYIYGWSKFKQSKYPESLKAFFQLLDLKLLSFSAAKAVENNSSIPSYKLDISSLNRSDRELVDDTLRVIALSFSYDQEALQLGSYFDNHGHRSYEYLIYKSVGDLYLSKDRIEDAARVYNAFVKKYPSHFMAPSFQVRVLEAYKKGGYGEKLLAAKEQFIQRYAYGSPYWNANKGEYDETTYKYLNENLFDLTKYYHAKAQKSKKALDYNKAAEWYEKFLLTFPSDSKAPEANFLLAEILFETTQYNKAAENYLKTAYSYGKHPKAAEAGYAAILAYDKMYAQLDAKDITLRSQAQKKLIQSSLQFIDAFSDDKRAVGVMTKTAENLYENKEYRQSIDIAKQVIEKQPTPDKKSLTVAWTVIAHSYFNTQDYIQAESGYQNLLKLMDKSDPKRKAIEENLAASIYKQGETLLAKGEKEQAVSRYLTISSLLPATSIAATAEYDAAAALISMGNWNKSITVLESFRKKYPKHQLQDSVSEKLASAYMKDKQFSKAARELEKMSSSNKPEKVRREALWQAAELQMEAKRSDLAINAYKNYIKKFPIPLERTIEARQIIADEYKKRNNYSNYTFWLQEIVKADKNGGVGRTTRTKYLAANAVLTLAEPLKREFDSVKLKVPLKKSLAQKKKKMKQLLDAYGRAADYGIAEVTTAATYNIGQVYYQFSKALLNSERPKGLSADELEEYSILLEDQAFPFEEKSIELHEANVKRVSQGLYDDWIKKSFGTLSVLLPARYNKAEKQEVVFDVFK